MAITARVTFIDPFGKIYSVDVSGEHRDVAKTTQLLHMHVMSENPLLKSVGVMCPAVNGSFLLKSERDLKI